MDPDVLARYNQKVKDYCEGNDPYGLKFEKTPLPRNVAYFDVCNYCIGKDSAYTHQSFRAYKSLQAFQHFENGWVQSVECKQISTGFIVVAKVSFVLVLGTSERNNGVAYWRALKHFEVKLCFHKKKMEKEQLKATNTSPDTVYE